jgi:hypothetical protein
MEADNVQDKRSKIRKEVRDLPPVSKSHSELRPHPLVKEFLEAELAYLKVMIQLAFG